MKTKPMNPRDISWLSFNARILQEAADPSVSLKDRIQFLSIHSSNLDEFFSIRVPALNTQLKIETKKKHTKAAKKIQRILNKIHTVVINQQAEFAHIWQGILGKLNKQKIYLLNENELTKKQKEFIREFYDKEISANIIPLFLESHPPLKPQWEKNVFLGVVMRSKKKSLEKKYAIIEIPTKAVGRFLMLPSSPGEQDIILLEDIIRFHLPYIFSSFGYDSFDAHLFKVTQDAEIDMESDLSASYLEKIASGVKNRRKAKPICFLYDKDMDSSLLHYLVRWLNFSKKDSIIPRGRIRNFRDFEDFPAKLPQSRGHHAPFVHHDFSQVLRVSDVVLDHDVLICPPYHSFNTIIDMLREAAMDAKVTSIHITAYRLAKHSKICNALINAARNGKKVSVVIELKAHFNEEANLNWKNKLEEEGVKVYVGVPNLKIHAKLCIIKKIIKKKVITYGFISTGNLNEDTALVYSDYCLLTSNHKIMKDIKRIFKAIEQPSSDWRQLKLCQTLLVSPIAIRTRLIEMIEREIKHKLNGQRAEIKLVMNSLSDEVLINKLYEAAAAGVEIRMIIRSIMCAVPVQKCFKKPLRAISIVDELLEHGRAWVFHNNGADDTFVTSADWMVRNMDYRVEVAVRITDPDVKKQLLEIINIKFSDNVKARILDNDLTNQYVKAGKKHIRSQIKIYQYLKQLKPKPIKGK